MFLTYFWIFIFTMIISAIIGMTNLTIATGVFAIICLITLLDIANN